LAKIAIYGGTFDPIHLGHLHVIAEVIKREIADRILLVPAGQPRLRDQAPSATGADRRAMCQAALKDLVPEIASRVEVNPIEILRSGPSYSIDTVEAVAHTYPGDQILLILGTDAFSKIEEWHRSKELQDMVDFVVIDRPDFPGSPNLDINALSVSATAVRAGEFEKVSPHVAAYIKEHNLYARK
jgi:nicotinate-nucleotide adenylyltransferase